MAIVKFADGNLFVRASEVRLNDDWMRERTTGDTAMVVVAQSILWCDCISSLRDRGRGFITKNHNEITTY